MPGKSPRHKSRESGCGAFIWKNFLVVVVAIYGLFFAFYTLRMYLASVEQRAVPDAIIKKEVIVPPIVQTQFATQTESTAAQAVDAHIAEIWDPPKDKIPSEPEEPPAPIKLRTDPVGLARKEEEATWERPAEPTNDELGQDFSKPGDKYSPAWVKANYVEKGGVKKVPRAGPFKWPAEDTSKSEQEYAPSTKKNWGKKYRPNRIWCMVPTMYPGRKDRMEVITRTWGKHCSKLVFVLDANSESPGDEMCVEDEHGRHCAMIMKVTVSRVQNNEIKKGRNIWEKVHRMWAKTAALYSEEAEWFFKGDDDTWVSAVGLRGFTQYYDPEEPHYLGHTFLHRWKKENLVFNSGVCYVMSRGALLAVAPVLDTMPTVDPPQQGPSQCIDRQGAGEDPTMGICLRGVGVLPTNTLDEYGRERFMTYRYPDHRKMWREDTWYWKFKPKNMADGTDCCSEYAVCYHNYHTHRRRLADHTKFLEIFAKLAEEYNSHDWEDQPPPPSPRLFIWDHDLFSPNEFDDYRNSKIRIPNGQRIYLGKDKSNSCHKCKKGDRWGFKEPTYDWNSVPNAITYRNKNIFDDDQKYTWDRG